MSLVGGQGRVFSSRHRGLSAWPAQCNSSRLLFPFEHLAMDRSCRDRTLTPGDCAVPPQLASASPVDREQRIGPFALRCDSEGLSSLFFCLALGEPKTSHKDQGCPNQTHLNAQRLCRFRCSWRRRELSKLFSALRQRRGDKGSPCDRVAVVRLTPSLSPSFFPSFCRRPHERSRLPPTDRTCECTRVAQLAS